MEEQQLVGIKLEVWKMIQDTLLNAPAGISFEALASLKQNPPIRVNIPSNGKDEQSSTEHESIGLTD